MGDEAVKQGLAQLYRCTVAVVAPAIGNGGRRLLVVAPSSFQVYTGKPRTLSRSAVLLHCFEIVKTQLYFRILQYGLLDSCFESGGRLRIGGAKACDQCLQ